MEDKTSEYSQTTAQKFHPSIRQTDLPKQPLALLDHCVTPQQGSPLAAFQRADQSTASDMIWQGLGHLVPLPSTTLSHQTIYISSPQERKCTGAGEVELCVLCFPFQGRVMTEEPVVLPGIERLQGIAAEGLETRGDAGDSSFRKLNPYCIWYITVV